MGERNTDLKHDVEVIHLYYRIKNVNVSEDLNTVGKDENKCKKLKMDKMNSASILLCLKQYV